MSERLALSLVTLALLGVLLALYGHAAHMDQVRLCRVSPKCEVR